MHCRGAVEEPENESFTVSTDHWLKTDQYGGVWAALLKTSTCFLRHLAVNACLAPIVSVDGKHVITVEGLGNSENPHPLQERLWMMNGSQCGFCTVRFTTHYCSSYSPTLVCYTNLNTARNCNEHIRAPPKCRVPRASDGRGCGA